MKGIVFTEFLEMVEQKFGLALADQIIQESHLPSGGVYTSIGTYDHAEIVELLTHLSQNTGTDASVLLKEFGRYLFDTFLDKFPGFFTSCADGFEFLESIENHIHVEVLKLYPDADLPRFDTERDGNSLKMVYQSSRKMSDLAWGLMERTMDYYGHTASIQKESMGENGEKVLFTISVVP
ncbi:MAG: hypothetical protein KIPDCIKN_00673 [Haliscomenobacter sp.]|jgi:hypothetical protein|nr:hypothetical protein [Haliscomenobacter sp.]